MPEPRPAHFRILEVIQELEEELDSEGGVLVEDVSDSTGLPRSTVARTIADMVHPCWDGGNPWLERAPRGGVWLTSAGGPAMTRAYAYAERNLHKWCDGVRWPSTQRQSDIDNAVIPQFQRPHCEDPELAAFRHADRLLPRVDEIDMTEEQERAAWRRMF